MFRPVVQNVKFPELETETLQFWNDSDIYNKSLNARAESPSFVFFEGPPTANGLPHPGHCLTRAIKDVFPRYKTMQGYFCRRKAGWDTHGLPVEVEVCKELGIHSKEEIEEYGIEPFIHKCQASVWRYMQEWEKLTERLGFWINMEEAYVTYHQSYVESVWWSLKNLFDRGLLYQGHKIVWWWAQGGTALSSGEVGQGYREVADPSVFVKFPLLDEAGDVTDESLLVWTTTPWTLPSNQFAAVHKDLEYSLVTTKEGEKLILASALVEQVAAKAKNEFTVEKTIAGTELAGKRYQPPFDYYYKDLGNKTAKRKDGTESTLAWRVLLADFVTTDSGTGVVHLAPAFGEVDYDVLVEEQDQFEPGSGLNLICAVGPNGKFTSEAPDYEGRWVKEADKDISRELRSRNVLFHLDQYLHDYPFCWRASEDPLIQYPRESWFIRTTKFKDAMLANNQEINWLPEHIKEGRFGNFLESNVDWALSRERYWGTPLPIWVCEETGYSEAIANYNELIKKPGATGMEVWEKALAENPDLSHDLKVHKPYIDEITYDSPQAPGARMRRVPEVIDCWYDSGSMPFAQWGYPQQNQEDFESQFPADFISEALDQTRGWFYSQLAISTLLFGEGSDATDNDARKDLLHKYPHPFKNCIVLGLMLSEWYEDSKKSGKPSIFLSEEDAKKEGEGKITKKIGKMSKQLRNYRSPSEIFDTYGADALRWYFFANQAPWNSIIYSERAIKESIPEFLLRLWNCYSFFVIYANIDGFDPAKTLNEGELGSFTAEQMQQASDYRPVSERSELDRWMLSELYKTVDTVTERMDAYDNYGACAAITALVDGMSNWFVRRSRNRFWASGSSQDKTDAYWTLYESLVVTTKMIAPFVPFISEHLWRNLVAEPFAGRASESVHLCDYPKVENDYLDENLSQQMDLMRQIVSLGRSARSDSQLKVRQPLEKVELILADNTHQDWLVAHSGLIEEELNVKAVELTENAEQYIEYSILPQLQRLGKRLGKQIPELKKKLNEVKGGELLVEMEAKGEVTFDLPSGAVTLSKEDLLVRLMPKEGWAAAQGKDSVVVLSTEITDELIAEGLAREITHSIQNIRKERDLEYTDRINVGLVAEGDDLSKAATAFKEYITGETLALELGFDPIADTDAVEVKIAGDSVSLYVQVVK